jgi:hypothetical protein
MGSHTPFSDSAKNATQKFLEPIHLVLAHGPKIFFDAWFTHTYKSLPFGLGSPLQYRYLSTTIFTGHYEYPFLFIFFINFELASFTNTTVFIIFC